MQKTALVTGGAGFLGSHLCDYLLERGYYVIAMDNLYTGRKQNLAHIDSPNFEFREQDIIRPIEVEQNLDEIYNLACPASPPQYQKDPIFTWKTSVFGTYNAIELARKKGAKFLQASTSEVYGDPKEHPQKETYWGNVNPVGIRSCYDEGKRAAESLIFDYICMHQVDAKIVRIFNTYGPRMNPADGRVVSNFVVQAKNNEDITIYGDGSQTRSFCYYSDLIEGFYRCMQTDQDFHGPVNLGNPTEFTVKELAEKVLSMTETQSKIIYKDLPSDDPKIRKPDITLAKEALNWEPKIPLEDGLRNLIEVGLN